MTKAAGKPDQGADCVGAVERRRVRHKNPAPSPTWWSRRSRRSTGRRPDLNTGGGTSDARFITRYCPVIEFGLVGQTMQQIDERTPVADLEKLTRIYRGVLDRYFA